MSPSLTPTSALYVCYMTFRSHVIEGHFRDVLSSPSHYMQHSPSFYKVGDDFLHPFSTFRLSIYVPKCYIIHKILNMNIYLVYCIYIYIILRDGAFVASDFPTGSQEFWCLRYDVAQPTDIWADHVASVCRFEESANQHVYHGSGSYLAWLILLNWR